MCLMLILKSRFITDILRTEFLEIIQREIIKFTGVDCSDHLLVLVPSHAVQIRADRWHTQECSNHWYSPQKVDGNREKSTEQDHEAVELNTHTNDGPSQQDYEDSSEESPAPLSFVPLEEKSEGSLQSNDTGQTGDKQNISYGE